MRRDSFFQVHFCEWLGIVLDKVSSSLRNLTPSHSQTAWAPTVTPQCPLLPLDRSAIWGGGHRSSLHHKLPFQPVDHSDTVERCLSFFWCMPSLTCSCHSRVSRCGMRRCLVRISDSHVSLQLLSSELAEHKQVVSFDSHLRKQTDWD